MIALLRDLGATDPALLLAVSTLDGPVVVGVALIAVTVGIAVVATLLAGDWTRRGRDA